MTAQIASSLETILLLSRLNIAHQNNYFAFCFFLSFLLSLSLSPVFILLSLLPSSLFLSLLMSFLSVCLLPFFCSLVLSYFSFYFTLFSCVLPFFFSINQFRSVKCYTNVLFTLKFYSTCFDQFGHHQVLKIMDEEIVRFCNVA
jgi:hypothetical protein